MKSLILLICLTGCAHPEPKEWWPSSHKQMMSECKVLCGKSGVFSYEALTGGCTCQK